MHFKFEIYIQQQFPDRFLASHTRRLTSQQKSHKILQ